MKHFLLIFLWVVLIGSLYSQQNSEHLNSKCDTLYRNSGKIAFINCTDSTGINFRKTYHENGNPMSATNYDADGAINGLLLLWHENGELSTECYYEHGSPVGKSIDYYPSGDTMNIRNCINDTCIIYEKDINGRLKSIQKSRFAVPFEKNVFYSNGNLMFKALFGKPYLFTSYDSLGNIESQCRKNSIGAFVGKYEQFYPNGKKKVIGNFLDHDGFNDIRDGKWIYYSKIGRVVKIEYYANNELMQRRTFKMLNWKKS